MKAAILAAGLTTLLLWATWDTAYEAGQRSPGCMEDEVLAVQHDPDPTHGLTWACENVEEFVERWSR